MTGESDVFFWVENLHAQYFFGSRDLSCIFLGLEKLHIFFCVLSLSELFISGYRRDQRIRKIFIRTFFSNMCSGKTVNIKKTIDAKSCIRKFCLSVSIEVFKSCISLVWKF